VRSRRFGWSLGLDPLPFGLCTYDCVYCQLGRTRTRSLGARMKWAPEQILAEVEQALARVGSEALDWITIEGAGEPTLYGGLGLLIRDLKALGAARVAVVTNGSLLHLPEVRAALAPADAVLPSLDAADERTFRAINRPHPGLDLAAVIEGLVEFRRSFRGALLVEVMLVDGLNDSDRHLDRLATVLRRVQPDAVQVGVPTRPPAEPWVQPPLAERFEVATAHLSVKAPQVTPADVFGRPPPKSAVPRLPLALAAILRRHPMTVEEMVGLTPATDPVAVDRALAALEQVGKVQRVERFGQKFWVTGRARFG
jgi:wyosine [tRNA(Phe)-imidazoG37] synthetase (radical SAM superfamily)